MNFLVLSSSRGTTFQAVLDRLADGSLTANCLGLLTDRDDRGCIEKAIEADLPVSIVPKQEGQERQDYDRQLHMAMMGLGATETTLIAALGWMYILSPWFVQQWQDRIINVHPALLPKFPGAHAVKDALDAGETETGMSIHLIDEGVDTGQILVQKNCTIEPDDTIDSLKSRIQELEKEWYPKTLQMIEEGEIELPHT